MFQHLEAQLLEEPLVLARPEPLLKTLLQLLADDGPLRGILDSLSSHELLELKIEPVPEEANGSFKRWFKKWNPIFE